MPAYGLRISDWSSNVCPSDLQEIRAAQRFIAHLADRNRIIGDCTQADIDAWLTKQPDKGIRFVRWLRDNGHVGDVALPGPVPKAGPRTHANPDEHWALVRRMLHDEHSASVQDRVAACLVLLYAPPLAKIVALTVHHIHTTDAGTYPQPAPAPFQNGKPSCRDR